MHAIRLRALGAPIPWAAWQGIWSPVLARTGLRGHLVGRGQFAGAADWQYGQRRHGGRPSLLPVRYGLMMVGTRFFPDTARSTRFRGWKAPAAAGRCRGYCAAAAGWCREGRCASMCNLRKAWLCAGNLYTLRKNPRFYLALAMGCLLCWMLTDRTLAISRDFSHRFAGV